MPLTEQLDSLSQHLGIDLLQDYRSYGHYVEIAGVKFAYPDIPADAGQVHYSLVDIVLSSVLRRRPERFEEIYENLAPFFHEGPYEYGPVCLKDGDVVIDCGANTGMFSAVADCYGARVYAIEAISDTIVRYLATTASLGKHITVVNNAVWDKIKLLEFAVIENHIGSACCQELLWGGEQVSERPKVQGITLDTFVRQMQLDRVDFIKADIEGAERNMLRGARNTLQRFKPRLSLCSYHRPDDVGVLQDLILAICPDYVMTQKWSKIYAYVP